MNILKYRLAVELTNNQGGKEANMKWKKGHFVCGNNVAVSVVNFLAIDTSDEIILKMMVQPELRKKKTIIGKILSFLKVRS